MRGPSLRSPPDKRPVISGNLQVGDKEVSHDKYYTLVLSSTPGEEGVRLTRPSAAAAEETRFVLIAGEPLDQPVVQVSEVGWVSGVLKLRSSSTVLSSSTRRSRFARPSWITGAGRMGLRGRRGGRARLGRLRERRCSVMISLCANSEYLELKAS